MPTRFSRLVALAPSRTLVVNCGASHLAVAEFSYDLRNRLWLERFALRPLDPAAVARKPWAEVIGETLAGLAKQEGWSGRCLVALSGQHTFTKFVRMSGAQRKRRNGVLEFEAQQAIPCPLSEVVWDHAVAMEENGDINFMLAASKREVAEGICTAVEAAGFAVEAILPSSTALLGAFRHGYPELCERTLLVHIGARSTHLVFLDEPRFFMRTFALGGQTLTQMIADELEMPLAEAERLKIAALTGCAPTEERSVQPKVEHVIGRFCQRLDFEITRSTALYRERYETPAPQVIALAGGAAFSPRLAQRLAEKFSCQVADYNAMRGVELSARLAGQGRTLPPIPAELIGLALARFQAEEIVPNLLPLQRRQALRHHRRQPALLAATGLLVVALLPLLGYWQLRARRAVEAMQRVEEKTAPLRRIATQNARNLATIEAGTARIERLHHAVDQRSTWLRFFADLQERFTQVENVWLERLQRSAVPEGSGPGAPPELVLGGRLLDAQNALSKVSPEAYARAQNLLQLVGKSPFVAGIKAEHFDTSEAGILRFSCTLVLSKVNPL